MSLNLNMVYYHIPLNKEASIHGESKGTTAPETFQEKKNEMFHGFEFIRVYIDHLHIITRGDW